MFYGPTKKTIGASTQGFTCSAANPNRMDRKDLMRARHEVPDLQARWKSRRHELETQLEIALNRLDQNEGKSHSSTSREAPAIYRQIARMDRSISFLDRALVHLDDIERGTHHAESLQLRPASSAFNQKNNR
jgi:hypothetical protein